MTAITSLVMYEFCAASKFVIFTPKFCAIKAFVTVGCVTFICLKHRDKVKKIVFALFLDGRVGVRPTHPPLPGVSKPGFFLFKVDFSRKSARLRVNKHIYI